MEDQQDSVKMIESQINRFNIRLQKLEKKSRSLGNARAIIFLSGLILFFISFFYLNTWSVISIAAFFLVASGILAKFHNNIDIGIKKQKIWMENKSINLARIIINWEKLPLKKLPEQNHSHPYESDLNISGEYSLHRLIDSSVTNEGSIKLLDWLTTRIPSFETIKWRQNLVKELIPLTRFREKLLLNSNLVTRKELYGRRLLNWLNELSNLKEIKNILKILSLLIPVNLIFILLGSLGILDSLWIITSSAIIAVHYFNLKYIKDLFDRSISLDEDIGKFHVIFKFLEDYTYGKNNLLKEFCKFFLLSETRPSFYFKKLNRIIFFASFQKNPLTRLLLNILFPWDFFQAYQLEKMKIELKEQAPQWLETWYALEALISLANFAYLNPSYTFPEISLNENGSPILETKNISHPLIPFEKNIPNDFKIDKKGEIVLITGSNMSGKSTFLKTVGLNLALAFAGGTVNAGYFHTVLFRIFTSINITDSVIDGISYFYAEVKRLKELLDELKLENSIPLFFLIDEIFKGTNNKERLVGSRSFIKALSGRNGTGLISTHDLELIKLEDEIDGVYNYHFKEEIADEKMIFNYKIMKGPSPTTNALKIMKLEGLPID